MSLEGIISQVELFGIYHLFWNIHYYMHNNFHTNIHCFHISDDTNIAQESKFSGIYIYIVSIKVNMIAHMDNMVEYHHNFIYIYRLHLYLYFLGDNRRYNTLHPQFCIKEHISKTR